MSTPRMSLYFLQDYLQRKCSSGIYGVECLVVADDIVHIRFREITDPAKPSSIYTKITSHLHALDPTIKLPEPKGWRERSGERLLVEFSNANIEKVTLALQAMEDSKKDLRLRESQEMERIRRSLADEIAGKDERFIKKPVFVRLLGHVDLNLELQYANLNPQSCSLYIPGINPVDFYKHPPKNPTFIGIIIDPEAESTKLLHWAKHAVNTQMITHVLDEYRENTMPAIRLRATGVAKKFIKTHLTPGWLMLPGEKELFLNQFTAKLLMVRQQALSGNQTYLTTTNKIKVNNHSNKPHDELSNEAGVCYQGVGITGIFIPFIINRQAVEKALNLKVWLETLYKTTRHCERSEAIPRDCHVGLQPPRNDIALDLITIENGYLVKIDEQELRQRFVILDELNTMPSLSAEQVRWHMSADKNHQVFYYFTSEKEITRKQITDEFESTYGGQLEKVIFYDHFKTGVKGRKIEYPTIKNMMDRNEQTKTMSLIAR